MKDKSKRKSGMKLDYQSIRLPEREGQRIRTSDRI
jgi:hypothetical protein